MSQAVKEVARGEGQGASENALTAERFFSLVEQYHCPQCDGAIDRSAVQANVIPSRGIGPTRRVVRVWCEHCRELFEASLVLVGSTWQIEGQPQIVTNEAVRRGFLKKYHFLRGDTVQAC